MTGYICQTFNGKRGSIYHATSASRWGANWSTALPISACQLSSLIIPLILSIVRQNIPLPAVIGRIVVRPLFHTIKLQPHLCLIWNHQSLLVESIGVNYRAGHCCQRHIRQSRCIASKPEFSLRRLAFISHTKITASALQSSIIVGLVRDTSIRLLGYVNPYWGCSHRCEIEVTILVFECYRLVMVSWRRSSCAWNGRDEIYTNLYYLINLPKF